MGISLRPQAVFVSAARNAFPNLQYLHVKPLKSNHPAPHPQPELIQETIADLNIEVHKVFTSPTSAIALSHIHCRQARPRHLPPVILAHGVFVNRNIWLSAKGRGMGAWLARSGFDVWLFEAREHGRALVRGVRRNSASFDDLVEVDVLAAIETVRHQTGAANIFWIGHSHGGILIYAHLGRYTESNSLLAGFVTVGTQTTAQNKNWRHWARLFSTPLLTGLFDYFPSRLLKLGPDDELKHVMTEWCQWNRRRRWTNRGFDYQAALQHISTPLLCLVGISDDMANPEGCERLFAGAGSPDKTFKVLGRKFANRIDYDHTSVIIGPDAEQEVWPMIASWLEAHSSM